MRTTGVVRWFSAERGFGFITCADGKEGVFVHHSALQSKARYKSIAVGDALVFDVVLGTKGERAVNVERVVVPAREDDQAEIHPYKD